MSFRYDPYSTRTRKRSSQDHELANLRDRADEPSRKLSAVSGERAWDYLLRRKAEDINDRIYKNKREEFKDETREDFSRHNRKIKKERVETDEHYGNLPLQMSHQDMSSSQNYTESRGFWSDTAGRWFNEEMRARVQSEFGDEHEANAVRSNYSERETTWRQTRHESQHVPDLDKTLKESYAVNIPAKSLSDKDLITNVSNYIEDARRTTKQSYRNNASTTHAFEHNMESRQAAIQSYSRNGNNETPIDIVPRDMEDAYTMQNYQRDSPWHYSMPNDNEDPYYSARNDYEFNHPSSQVSYYNSPNYSKNTDRATRQSYGRTMPDETLFHNRPNNDDQDLRHLITSNSGRNLPADLPFDPPLTYNTPDSVEDASVAAKQRYKKNKQVTAGNHTLIHSLPYPAEGVEVVYTADPVEAEAWLRKNVIDCATPAIGFDIEWKPQFVSKKNGGKENKTAVLQLAVESSCLVLHLHQMKKQPKYLRSVLNSTKILKVGSGILQDVVKLNQDTQLKCIGLIDTQTMAKSVGVPASSKLGLKALAERFLGIHLNKPKSVSNSNWERFPLTIQQIHYAAFDAWIGLKIYQQMKSLNDETRNPVKVTSIIPLKTVSCHVCNKKLKGEDALAQHIKIHAKCKCGKFFQVKISKSHKKECTVLNAHKETSSKQTLDVPLEEAGLSPCQACGKGCRSVKALIEHIREFGHVSCPFCTRLLHSVSSYSHIKKCRNFLSEPWKKFATDQVIG